MQQNIFRIVIFSISLCQVINHSVSAQLIPNLGGQRAGVSSFTFLKNDVSPRAQAMAGANTVAAGDAYAAHWNPAALTELHKYTIAFSNRLFGLGIHQSFAAANYKLTQNDALSVHVNNLTSGLMEERTEFQPRGTGILFSTQQLALGVSYAKALTYKFSFGTTLRYASEQFLYFKSQTVVIDVGFIYKTDFKDLRFGVFLQNFGPNTRAQGSHQTISFSQKKFNPDAYPIPTVFKFGASMIPFKKDKHVGVLTAELNHPNDNATNIRLGMEYIYWERLFFRAGYWANRSAYAAPTFGLGLQAPIKNQQIQLGYAFIPSRMMGIQHTVGFSIHFIQASQPKVTDEATQ